MNHDFECNRRTRLQIMRHVLAALAASLVFLSQPAKAIILFDNPGPGAGQGTHWCDPCSSGNTGYRVWDSFSLALPSTIQSIRWIGLRSDAFTLGAVIEIALAPYGASLYSATFPGATITEVDTGLQSSFNTVQVPNWSLGLGTYWISIHGPSVAEQFTWLGAFNPNRDNSLIQYGPDPDNPQFVIPRNQDAIFRLNGFITPIPEPSTWAMMLLGFAGAGFMAYRRRKFVAHSS